MRSIPTDFIILGCGSLYNIGRRTRPPQQLSPPIDPITAFPRNRSYRRRSIALLPARPVHTDAPRGCLRRAQDGRLPLHIAAMQQGDEAETVVTLLLKAHPAGAKERDFVRCLAAHS